MWVRLAGHARSTCLPLTDASHVIPPAPNGNQSSESASSREGKGWVHSSEPEECMYVCASIRLGGSIGRFATVIDLFWWWWWRLGSTSCVVSSTTHVVGLGLSEDHVVVGGREGVCCFIVSGRFHNPAQCRQRAVGQKW